MRPVNLSGVGTGAPSPRFMNLPHQTIGFPIVLSEKPSAAFLMATYLNDLWPFSPTLPILDCVYQNLYSSEPLGFFKCCPIEAG